MKPAGRLIFIEISASPDLRVRQWQRRWEPLHQVIFEGLFLTRDIPSLLQASGFSLESITPLIWRGSRSPGRIAVGGVRVGTETHDFTSRSSRDRRVYNAIVRILVVAAVLVVSFAVCVTVPLSGIQPCSAAGDQRDTGTIEGRVTFDGTPPPPTIVIQDGGSQQVLYVDRSGGLRYAVVFLPDARGGAPAPAPPATMNQRNFIFEPQVLAVRSGQTIRFMTDDSANHNVRARDPNPQNTFSIYTGPGAIEPDTHRFAATTSEHPLELSCDIHPWMVAWIYAFDHGQFAVTNADGTFRIGNVPVGRQRIAIRQPSGGLARDLTVDVIPDATVRLEVRFAAKGP